jgi:hypothetical protein
MSPLRAIGELEEFKKAIATVDVVVIGFEQATRYCTTHHTIMVEYVEIID